MDLQEILSDFFNSLSVTAWYEYLAVISGILSVWYSKKASVLVYPVGLVNTLIYIYISLSGHLPGEAIVNLYYTAMSILGWYWWLQKDSDRRIILQITRATRREAGIQILYFLILYTLLFLLIYYFRMAFFEGAIPWADALASASGFTAMWLMARKKIECWYFWILTNIVSVPLYFVKHYVFTSIYFIILLLLAIGGLWEWNKKLKTGSHAG
jgi:nicotinamide mononucleotide transporter